MNSNSNLATYLYRVKPGNVYYVLGKSIHNVFLTELFLELKEITSTWHTVEHNCTVHDNYCHHYNNAHLKSIKGSKTQRECSSLSTFLKPDTSFSIFFLSFPSS